tara:strand:+ start:1202 stop:1549 length:348 start_codon:yes stop_codon:yes gene_type:complete
MAQCYTASNHKGKTMLIKFKSEQSGDFVMTSDVALPLLKMMGASGKSEGAVSSDALRTALGQLESALRQLPAQDQDQDEDDEAEANVSLATRASPLLAMLRKAAAEDGYVMWQED